MKQTKTYAIFGLGRYGKAVALELIRHGADVIAVDINEEIVNDLSTEIPVCKCADVTDQNVLRQLGVPDMDVVIIAMARNFEASVLSIMLCKELGVKTVIAKCSNEMNYRILKRLGADKVVFPERESGVRLAKGLLHGGPLEFFDLSDDLTLTQLQVRQEWVGKTLRELDLRGKYSINIVAIRDGEALLPGVDPDAPLTASMQLIGIQ
jgi:trk system potassium uptake protein TrkA